MSAVAWNSLRGETRRAVRAGGLMMAAGLATGLGNLVFNVVVARSGGAASYGVLGPLLTITTISGFLATGSQYAVARLVAIGGSRPSRRLMPLALGSVSPWLALSLLLLGLSYPIAAYMHLHSAVPVVLTALLAAATVVWAAPAGLLVGASRFPALASLMFGSVALRLALGLLLGHGSGTVDGALLASLLPIVVTACVSFILVHRALRVPVTPGPAAVAENGSGVMSTGVAGALIAGTLWVLWTIPVLSARHVLSPSQAGQVAAVQLLAGGILFVCAPLITGFYPTLASSRHWQPVLVGLVATSAVGMAGVTGLTTVGHVLMPRLYGPQFAPSSLVLLALSVSAALVALGTYACWVAVARRLSLTPVFGGLAVGLVTDLGLCALWAHSAAELGISPALSVGAAAVAAVGLRTLIATRASESSPLPGGEVGSAD